MKKLSIITAIMLLAVTAFSQPHSRERERQRMQDHKSEASVRRTVNNPKSNATTRRTAPNHKSESTARRQVERRQTDRTGPVSQQRKNSVQAYNKSSRKGNTSRNSNTRAIKTRQGDRRYSADYQTRAKGNNSGVVRTGNHKPNNAGHKARNNNKYRTTGNSGHKTKGNGSYGKNSNNNRSNYVTPNRRHVRKPHVVKAHHTPARYRTVHKHYRAPRHAKVIWTNSMYREYRVLYPNYHYWYYPTGHRIVNVPAYRAYFHVGELRNVYGRVHEVWYSLDTDEYYLYFGGTYPYHDFSVILSGRNARKFHRHPEVFFSGRYIWVTGLVSTFNGKPEIMVMRKHQVHLYAVNYR